MRTSAGIVLFGLSMGAMLNCKAEVAASPIDREVATRCSTSQAQYDEANIRRCTAKLALPGLSTEERAMTFNARGNNYDALKEFDLAIADYTEVIRLLPKFEYGYANRALEKYRKGNYLAAVVDYDQALLINPKSSYARYGRGVARLKSGDTVGGKADLSMAIQLDPEMANVYRGIGMVP